MSILISVLSSPEFWVAVGFAIVLGIFLYLHVTQVSYSEEIGGMQNRCHYIFA